MLLLVYCGVPGMSYLLRVTPPAAIQQLASEFDHVLFSKVKLLLDLEGRATANNSPNLDQLHQPLKYGGFAITKASQTSHIAYLASVATAAAMKVFADHSVRSLP